MRIVLGITAAAALISAVYGCSAHDNGSPEAVAEKPTQSEASRGLEVVVAALPERIGGLIRSASDTRFGRDELFSYMNGAGELYLGFGFEELVVRRYRNEAGHEAVVELYDMGCSADAWGMCRIDTEGEQVGIGQGGFYSAGLLRFWRDRYFVRLVADRDGAQTKAQLVSAAEQLAAAIGSDGKPPRLLDALDPEWRDDPETRFFHTDACLSMFYYLGSDNRLDLSPRTSVVLARPPRPRQRAQVLVISYLDAEAARGALTAFATDYLDEPLSTADFVVSEESGRSTGGRVWHSSVVLVIDALDRSSCIELLDSTIGRIREMES